MKRILTIIVVLVLTLCSCTDSEIVESDKSKNITDLVSREYKIKELDEIAAYNGSINELDSIYLIECCRKTDRGYRVSYLGEDCVLVFQFDENGNKLSSSIYERQYYSNYYESISIGASLDFVKNLDPGADYLFLFSGRNDLPKISSHYTKDGYLITIKYDESNCVFEVNKELI